MLSAGLASRRRANGLTQPALAALLDCSLTTVGHAETGRLWQSRDFWEQADKALRAGGELLRLHDAWRAVTTPAAISAGTDSAEITAAAPGSSSAGPSLDRDLTYSTETASAPGGGAGARPGAGDDQDFAGLLTDDEHEAGRLAGLLYTHIAEHVVAHGPTRDDDLAELRTAVHVIQRMVEAQASARAYPYRYRLLGSVIPKRKDE